MVQTSITKRCRPHTVDLFLWLQHCKDSPQGKWVTASKCDLTDSRRDQRHHLKCTQRHSSGGEEYCFTGMIWNINHLIFIYRYSLSAFLTLLDCIWSVLFCFINVKTVWFLEVTKMQCSLITSALNFIIDAIFLIQASFFFHFFFHPFIFLSFPELIPLFTSHCVRDRKDNPLKGHREKTTIHTRSHLGTF